MKFYKITDEPIAIHGLNHINPEKNEYWRLTEDILEKMPQYEHLGRRTAGARVRFKTNSKQILIKYSTRTEFFYKNTGVIGSSGVDVYLGSGIKSKFVGYVCPETPGFKDNIIEGTIIKSDKLETVTINLPRNEHISYFEIGIDDDAEICSADEYTVKKPIIFYGSSITEGGCAGRVGGAYTSILCRWLDADYFNYGFSGKAKGEEVVAEYITKHKDMSLFVYDYDHNAPNPEHLQETHKKFLDIIRKANKTVPVIILTRPDTDANKEDSAKRRDIIYNTYKQYHDAGDKNIYFIDGEEFFGIIGRSECTVDGVHPTSLGFFRMAEKIYPLAKEVLHV